jgi:putative transposase
MQLQGNLAIERMCLLAQVSRAGFYRYLQAAAPAEEEVEVRAVIQEVALAHRRRYGYRRVTAELHARGLCVNHKRVARLMRADNLLAITRRKFVRTTDSQHQLPVHINVAAQMQVTAADQLWVADLTYIRLRTSFVYLAVVLDAFTRRVVGWSLGRSLTADLPTAALRQAIALRQPQPGLVHHSDRGVQYASKDYLELLAERQLIASMSRPGNPYDNAKCESFMKTLKQEEIYANTYRDEEDLRTRITEFIDEYYNRVRLHSALGYKSPERFEQALRQQQGPATPVFPKLSFLRHREIYPSDVST